MRKFKLKLTAWWSLPKLEEPRHRLHRLGFDPILSYVALKLAGLIRQDQILLGPIQLCLACCRSRSYPLDLEFS